MGAFQLRQAMAWQRTDDPDAVHPWFLRGTPGFELVPELAPRDDEAILDKITFSAFEGTPLAMILRDLGLSTLRVMTNMIEPIMIVVMALGVGFLLLSVLSAMFAIVGNVSR